jgi:hypothetical protein
MSWLPTTAMFSATPCNAAQIETVMLCQQREAAAFAGRDSCDAIAAIAQCWPVCFCIHSQGYRKLRTTLQPLCTTLPACGPRPPMPAYVPSSHAPHTVHRAPGDWAFTAALASALVVTFALTS